VKLSGHLVAAQMYQTHFFKPVSVPVSNVAFLLLISLLNKKNLDVGSYP
jgi:hypothetical protein